MIPSEQLAQKFHEAYERLAPQFGYETRKESAVPWEQVPERNRELMVAVCAELLASYVQERVDAELEKEWACGSVVHAWPDETTYPYEWALNLLKHRNKRLRELAANRAKREKAASGQGEAQ